MERFTAVWKTEIHPWARGTLHRTAELLKACHIDMPKYTKNGFRLFVKDFAVYRQNHCIVDPL